MDNPFYSLKLQTFFTINIKKKLLVFFVNTTAKYVPSYKSKTSGYQFSYPFRRKWRFWRMYLS